MNTRRTFRIIWRANAVVILATGLGVCAMLGYAAVSFLASRLQLRHKDAIVNVDAAVGAQWQLGAFTPLYGTPYIIAAVSSAQTYSVGISEKEASATRNYLFVNTLDKSSRWLIPDNSRLILSMEQIDADGSVIGWDNKNKAVKWLFLDVVPADTDGDKRLTSADRKAVAIANADGSNYVEVLQGVDSVYGKTCNGGEKLLIVYSAQGKHVISEIDVLKRKVTTTKDLPKLGQ